MVRGRRHSGFNVYAAPRIHPREKRSLGEPGRLSDPLQERTYQRDDHRIALPWRIRSRALTYSPSDPEGLDEAGHRTKSRHALMSRLHRSSCSWHGKSGSGCESQPGIPLQRFLLGISFVTAARTRCAYCSILQPLHALGYISQVPERVQPARRVAALSFLTRSGA